MPTVADCWALYQDHLSKTCNPSANQRYWGRLQWFADKDAGRLSPMEVDAYIAMRGVKPATMNRELALLRACLKAAERSRVIDRAPHIRSVVGAIPKLRALSTAEVSKVVAAADKGCWQEQVYIRLALGTGARPEATISLKWEQVHKGEGSIDYRVQSDLTPRMKRRAVVPINKMVSDALKLAASHRSGDYVIHHDGKRYSSPRQMMRRIAKRAGVKDCSPHVLRHTVASILLAGGEDLLKVSRLLGHASSTITEQVYFQHPPSWLKTTTDKLDF